jgi:hypothetical protein
MPQRGGMIAKSLDLYAPCADRIRDMGPLPVACGPERTRIHGSPPDSSETWTGGEAETFRHHQTCMRRRLASRMEPGTQTALPWACRGGSSWAGKAPRMLRPTWRTGLSRGSSRSAPPRCIHGGKDAHFYGCGFRPCAWSKEQVMAHEAA